MSTTTEPSTLGKVTRQRRLMSGFVITLLVTLMALFGPLFAPYGENEVVGPPFAK